jgi:ABC-type arginine/histidine transport system permease subunit
MASDLPANAAAYLMLARFWGAHSLAEGGLPIGAVLAAIAAPASGQSEYVLPFAVHALAAVVGVIELTAHVNKINLDYAQPVFLYTTGGLIYMAIALTIGLHTGRLERNLVIAR